MVTLLYPLSKKSLTAVSDISSLVIHKILLKNNITYISCKEFVKKFTFIH